MATAGESLVQIRVDIRAYDEQADKARVAVIARGIETGEIPLEADAVTRAAAESEYEEDRKILDAELMVSDGYVLNDGYWIRPESWPGVPRRQPMPQLETGDRGAASGGGSGGGDGGDGGGGDGGAQLSLQDRLEAQAWEQYYAALSAEKGWTKRYKRWPWAVAKWLAPMMLANPQARKMMRGTGIPGAADLFAEQWPDRT